MGKSVLLEILNSPDTKKGAAHRAAPLADSPTSCPLSIESKKALPPVLPLGTNRRGISQGSSNNLGTASLPSGRSTNCHARQGNRIAQPKGRLTSRHSPRVRSNLLNPILLETLTAGTLPWGTPPPLLTAKPSHALRALLLILQRYNKILK